MAYTTSVRWKNAVRQAGFRKTVIDLYYNKQTIPVISDLPVISGSVTVDGKAANRRSGSVTLASPQLINTDPTATLEPFGLELGIRSGVVYPDGSEELVPLGIFPIDDISFDDDQGNIPTVTFFDRSYFIQEQVSQDALDNPNNRFLIEIINSSLGRTVFTTVAGSPFLNTRISPPQAAGAIALVYDNYSQSKNFKFPGGVPPTPESNYWDSLQSGAQGIGSEIFFDVTGINVILQQIPELDDSNTTADAVATVDAGPTGVLVTASRNISRADSYNAVSYTGVLAANAVATANPPYAFVAVSDPRSPYFYGGPFGKKVFVTTDNSQSNNTALLGAATALLKSMVGLAHGLSLTMLPDPSLDSGDIINVIFRDGSNELHMIDTITFDLAGGLMAVTTMASNTI